MKFFFSILLFVAAYTGAFCQNLVPNPSFEEYISCPFWIAGPGGFPMHIAYSPGYDSFPTVKGWVSPLSTSSPDYFNRCETATPGHGTPTNTLGSQSPKNGEAYVGVYMKYKNSSTNDYREYIEARLLNKMIGGHEYHLSFYVSLAVSHLFPSYCKIFTTNDIGAYVSDTIIATPSGFVDVYLAKPLTVRSLNPEFITDTTAWVKIEGSHIANGNEQWITIGHFKDVFTEKDSFLYANVNTTPSFDTFSYCYMYIDDVCVMDVTDSARDTVICATNFPVALKGHYNEAGNYTWNTGQTTPEISVTQPGIYWRKAVGECLSAIDTFKVLTKPYTTLGSDREVCPYPLLVLNTPLPLTTYRWNTGDTNCCITVDKTGIYAVTAINACGEERGSTYITLLPSCDTCIWAPRAFTPNEDGHNDVFRARSRCQLSSYQLKIYNRIGIMVYETTDIDKGWDGTLNGVPQDVGAFYYYIRCRTNVPGESGEEHTIKGDVTLIR